MFDGMKQYSDKVTPMSASVFEKRKSKTMSPFLLNNMNRK